MIYIVFWKLTRRVKEEIFAAFLQTFRLFSYLEYNIVREIAKEAIQVRMSKVILKYAQDTSTLNFYESSFIYVQG